MASHEPPGIKLSVNPSYMCLRSDHRPANDGNSIPYIQLVQRFTYFIINCATDIYFFQILFGKINIIYISSHNHARNVKKIAVFYTTKNQKLAFITIFLIFMYTFYKTKSCTRNVDYFSFLYIERIKENCNHVFEANISTKLYVTTSFVIVRSSHKSHKRKRNSLKWWKVTVYMSTKNAYKHSLFRF